MYFFSCCVFTIHDWMWTLVHKVISHLYHYCHYLTNNYHQCLLIFFTIAVKYILNTSETMCWFPIFLPSKFSDCIPHFFIFLPDSVFIISNMVFILLLYFSICSSYSKKFCLFITFESIL